MSEKKSVKKKVEHNHKGIKLKPQGECPACDVLYEQTMVPPPF